MPTYPQPVTKEVVFTDEIGEERVYEETELVLDRTETNRGFPSYGFADRYGQQCSLQESSLATEGAIWFGVDNTGPCISGPNGERNEKVGARMHLTQAMVKQLMPIFEHFLETGYLPIPEETKT